MSTLTELKYDIATSIFILPCTEEELLKRDFLENRSSYGVHVLLKSLKADGAIYHRKDVMHIKKSWAKKYLKDRELDL